MMTTIVIQISVCKYHGFFLSNEPELFGEIANSRDKAEEAEDEPGMSWDARKERRTQRMMGIEGTVLFLYLGDSYKDVCLIIPH